MYRYLSEENDIISFVNGNEVVNYCNFGIRCQYEQTYSLGEFSAVETWATHDIF